MGTTYLSAEKREAIINSMTTPHLSIESLEDGYMKQAKMLINCGSPKLAKQGRRLLQRTQNRKVIRLLRQIKKALPVTLDEQGAKLLAETRTEFLNQLDEKEKENENKQTTTPLS